MHPYRANQAVAYLFRSRRITRLQIIRIYPKYIFCSLWGYARRVGREGGDCECSPPEWSEIYSWCVSSLQATPEIEAGIKLVFKALTSGVVGFWQLRSYHFRTQ